jgi:homopolymeric O-antigen transport system permease protein
MDPAVPACGVHKPLGARYWRAVRAYRYLYEQMVRRELRQKYKGSVLGVLYYLINPLVLMVAYAVMTKYVLKFDAIDDYPLFLLIGIGTWLFFSQSLMASATSLIDQSSLVRKVRFPREIIPAAVVSVQFVIFAVLIALLTPVALAVRDSLSPALLLLPVVLALLAAFALGLGLVVSVLHAYYRDVAPILSAALLPWFFLSPIFFRTTDFPGLDEHPVLGDLLRWGNPIAPFIEAVRAVLYDGRSPGLATLAYIVVAAGLAVLGGRALFRRLQGELAVVL